VRRINKPRSGYSDVVMAASIWRYLVMNKNSRPRDRRPHHVIIDRSSPRLMSAFGAARPPKRLFAFTRCSAHCARSKHAATLRYQLLVQSIEILYSVVVLILCLLYTGTGTGYRY